MIGSHCLFIYFMFLSFFEDFLCTELLCLCRSNANISELVRMVFYDMAYRDPCILLPPICDATLTLISNLISEAKSVSVGVLKFCTPFSILISVMPLFTFLFWPLLNYSFVVSRTRGLFGLRVVLKLHGLWLIFGIWPVPIVMSPMNFRQLWGSYA